MIYLSTAIRLTPDDSSTVQIYTQTINRTTQITTNLEYRVLFERNVINGEL